MNLKLVLVINLFMRRTICLMHMKKRVLVFLVYALPVTFFLILSGCNRIPDGNAVDGERWFKLNRCIGCHGEKGVGGRGPTIARTSLSYRRFLNKLRNPKSAIMPTFEPKQVSDQDAADIYLWLQEQKK